jgi:hypothetical protein
MTRDRGGAAAASAVPAVAIIASVVMDTTERVGPMLPAGP